MAYNYLALVNEVQRRLNEVELTSTNFDTAKGSHALSKDAVNSAVRHVIKKSLSGLGIMLKHLRFYLQMRHDIATPMMLRQST